MSQIKELLVDQLKDLLHAEMQLTGALPKMAAAANHPNLRSAFEKHKSQTEAQVLRLKQIFELLQEEAEPKPCKAMMGLVEEGKETIEDWREKEPMTADLALIAAAQRVEHYEISAYGTARCLARQLGEFECATLLSHTLGEEEASDYLLTAISAPIMQQVSLNDMGSDVDLETVGGGADAPRTRSGKKTAKKT